ncbi:MAG: PqiC family protein [Bilophila sp.]
MVRSLRATAGVLLGGLVLLGGCSLGRSPQTEFYMLASPAEMRVPDERVAVSGPRVAIGPVIIPAYIDRPQLFLRNGNSVHVQLADFRQWSEPMSDGITRVLCDALSASLAPRHGQAFALRAPLQAQWKLSVDIARFDGAPGGEVMLDAGWTLQNADGNEVRSGRFVRRTPAGDSTITLVQAHSDLLAAFGSTLGKMIP